MPKLMDLTDRTFGSVVVINRAENVENGHARWKCRCKCGNEFIAYANSLRSGRTTTCGCSHVLDLSNQKFNKLTAICRDPENTKHGKSRWLCRCDCGRDVVVIGSHLINGNTKSCGCNKMESITNIGKNNALENSGALSLYGHHKGGAAQRGIEFCLTFEEFVTLTSGDCIYCGQPPAKIVLSRKGKSPYLYNGIDRLNSNESYNPKNCASCCSVCNYSKRTMSYDEFMAWVSRVYHHQQKRKK